MMQAAYHFIASCLRLVVLVVTNGGVLGPLLGCAPTVLEVPAYDSTAFQQMLQNEQTADARRPAQGMKQWVRGDRPDKHVGVLDDATLPEAYTPNGERGIAASQFHLGYAALRLIREYYAAAHPAHQVLERGDLVEIVEEAGGNTYVVNDFDRQRLLDIADIEGRFVFKVVPPGQTHQAAAKKKIDWQLLLLNQAMLGVPKFKLGTGYEGEIGVRFAEGAMPWKLAWSTTEPGVVQYRWWVLGAEEPKGADAYAEDRWHQPTYREMVRLGRALHEVVERLVQAREALGQTRAAAHMPMVPGKTLADYFRSVGWWSDNDEGIARLLPVMREPPLPPPPPPPPATKRADPRLVAQTTGAGASALPLLTTRELRRLYGNPKGNVGILYNRDVGLMFQGLVLMHMPGPRMQFANTKPFASKVREKQTNGRKLSVIPDGVAGASIGSQSPLGALISTYPESTFIEVKAVKGIITLKYGQYQIEGMLDVLSQSQAARSTGDDRAFPNMYFVTTGDTIIGPDVIAEATKLNILLWHSYVAVHPTDDVQVLGPTCLNCVNVLLGNVQMTGFVLPGLRFRIKSQPLPRVPVLFDAPILDDGLVGDPGLPGSTTPNP